MGKVAPLEPDVGENVVAIPLCILAHSLEPMVSVVHPAALLGLVLQREQFQSPQGFQVSGSCTCS